MITPGGNTLGSRRGKEGLKLKMGSQEDTEPVERIVSIVLEQEDGDVEEDKTADNADSKNQEDQEEPELQQIEAQPDQQDDEIDFWGQISRSPSPGGASYATSYATSYAVQEKETTAEEDLFDDVVASFIYATNSQFKIAEHPSFINMFEMLHPGYKPPTRHQVAGRILNRVYEKERQKCIKNVEGTNVCMSLDGWAITVNEPIICSSITSFSSNTYLVESVDTKGHPQPTPEYLFKIAVHAIQKCEKEYGCKVGSFVTDNAINVLKMRNELLKDDLAGLICYGCSTHILNLLLKDLGITNIKEHIVQIVKYFSCNEVASSAYKAAGGSELKLYKRGRWNTLSDSCETCLENWEIMAKVCEGPTKDKLDKTIMRKIMDSNIKICADDMSKVLKHIVEALDRVQRKQCDIGESLEVWKILEHKMKEVGVSKDAWAKFKKRMALAISPMHSLANLMHPLYRGKRLSTSEVNQGTLWLGRIYPGVKDIIIKAHAGSEPFTEAMYQQEMVEAGPKAWWQSHKDILSKEAYDFACQIFTTTASTVGADRMFSSFGMVQSVERSRIGPEKAEKLAFIYTALNQNMNNDDD